MYSYQLDCHIGENTMELPDYFTWLATEPLVYVSPYKCFGSGWGDIDSSGTTPTITVNMTGKYDVIIWATRKDTNAVKELNQFGVEHPEPSSTSN